MTKKVRIRTVRLLVTAAALALAAVPLRAEAGAAPVCTAGTGPYQRELEEHLGLPVDGHQSAADCAAIQGFQGRNGIKPADGYAGLATYRIMLVVEARSAPNAAGKCPVRAYDVACVDLDRQIMWVQNGGNIVFPPVPIRSGRDGYETRTGWHRVYWKDRDHYSDLYNNAPMPFAQFFSDGQAFHGSPEDLFKGGSHGCVNLQYADAERLWDVLEVDDAVYIWGVKPGTYRSAPSPVTPDLPPTDDPPSPPAVHTPPPNPGVL